MGLVVELVVRWLQLQRLLLPGEEKHELKHDGTK